MFYKLVVAAICFDVALSVPNIVFVLVDDFGYNDIGYHGSEIKTPNLDRLARNGVILENYYVQPICTPTRSCLLSGRYQIHTGLQHGNIMPSVPKALPTDSYTLADKLQQAGYNTHCVGKWHLGFYKEEFMPMNRGFDTFYGFLVGSKSHYHHRRCHKGMCGHDFRENGTPVNTKRVYSTKLFSDKVVDIIQNHKSRKPLFIYLPYQAPHSPVDAPRKYVNLYPNIQSRERRVFAGMVSAIDEGVGNITKALKDQGLWENTILIFSSDNGGQVIRGGSNYPLRGNKGGNFEGGIRGVGFVSGGYMRNRGRISTELMHVTDWFPTFINLGKGNYIGVKPLDGVDQWKAINGGRSQRRVLLHGIDPLARKVGKPWASDTFDSRTSAAIRIGDMKLLTGKTGSREYNPNTVTGQKRQTPNEPRNKNVWLFNITADPLETRDLSSSHPVIVRELLNRLADFDRTSISPQEARSDPRADPDRQGGFWGPWVR